MKSKRSSGCVILGSGLIALAVLGSAGGGPPRSTDVQQAVAEQLGLDAVSIIEATVPDKAGGRLLVPINVDDEVYTLDLAPRSVRAKDFQVLLQVDGGALIPVDPGPIRTLHGVVREIPGSRVVASQLQDGLHATIHLPDGGQHALQPVASILPGAARNSYVFYHVDNDITPAGVCGVSDDAVADVPDPVAADGGISAGGSFVCAEIACDADFTYFQAHILNAGLTQASIETIVNELNERPYGDDAQILYRITAIIIRTSSADDPYNSSNPQTLLNQFQAHWNQNHDDITRDVAELFTNRIGDNNPIAGVANIGSMCNDLTAYCLTEHRHGWNVSARTDLSAHELGHVWGLLHCDCDRAFNEDFKCPTTCGELSCNMNEDGCEPGTMNPCIINARNFHSICSLPDLLDLRDNAVNAGCVETCSPEDCNSNGIPDEVDVANGTSADGNSNGIPDECEGGCSGVPCPPDAGGSCLEPHPGPGCVDPECCTAVCCQQPLCCLLEWDEGCAEAASSICPSCATDCNGNGQSDCDDLLNGDCNGNGIPDDCDISGGTSDDVNSNGVPDECEDCNGNGIPDELDVANGTSSDYNCNGFPDECELCSLDIVFAMDTSASMDDELAVVCSIFMPTIQTVLDPLVSGTLRLTALGIRDTEAWTCLTGTVLNDVCSTVPGTPGLCGSTLCGGPGQCEESWGPATAILAESFDWNSDAVRVVVPVSDEGACVGDPCEQADDESVVNAIAVALANAVRAYPVIGYGSLDCTDALATQLADGTHGKAFFIPGGNNPTDFAPPNIGDLYEQIATELALSLLELVANCVDGAERLDCPWDLNANGTVDTVDFLALLTAWGPCPGPVCPADFDCSGDVGATDFLALLSHWGLCDPDPTPPCP